MFSNVLEVHPGALHALGRDVEQEPAVQLQVDPLDVKRMRVVLGVVHPPEEASVVQRGGDLRDTTTELFAEHATIDHKARHEPVGDRPLTDCPVEAERLTGFDDRAGGDPGVAANKKGRRGADHSEWSVIEGQPGRGVCQFTTEVLQNHLNGRLRKM